MTPDNILILYKQRAAYTIPDICRSLIHLLNFPDSLPHNPIICSRRQQVACGIQKCHHPRHAQTTTD